MELQKSLRPYSAVQTPDALESDGLTAKGTTWGAIGYPMTYSLGIPLGSKPGPHSDLAPHHSPY